MFDVRYEYEPAFHSVGWERGQVSTTRTLTLLVTILIGF